MTKNPIPGGLRSLPFIGDEFSKVGRVINILNNPCSPTPKIWVQAFFYRLPHLVFSIFKPEWFNVSPYTAKGRKNVGHRRNVKRNVSKRVRLKMDVDAVFRLTVPVPEGMRWVPIAYYALQRTLFWLLVLDATTDFAVLWTSTAYQWQGCSLPDQPWASGKRNNLIVFPPIANWYTPTIEQWTAVGMSAGGNRVAIPPGVECTLFGTCMVVPQPPPKHGTISGIRFVDVDTGEVLGEAHDPVKPGWASMQSLVVQMPAFSQVQRIVEMQVFHDADGYAMSVSAEFEAFCFSFRGLTPDP